MAATIDWWTEYQNKGLAYYEFECPCPEVKELSIGHFLLEKIYDKPIIYNLLSMIINITQEQKDLWFTENLCLKKDPSCQKNKLSFQDGYMIPVEDSFDTGCNRLEKLLPAILGQELIDECIAQSKNFVNSLKYCKQGPHFAIFYKYRHAHGALGTPLCKDSLTCAIFNEKWRFSHEIFSLPGPEVLLGMLLTYEGWVISRGEGHKCRETRFCY